MGPLSQAPWLAQVATLSRPLVVPELMTHAEMVLSALDGHGLSNLQAHNLQILLYNHVQGLAVHLERAAQEQAHTGLTDDEWMETQNPGLEAIARSGRHPVFTRITTGLGPDYDFDFDEFFAFSLIPLLNGVESLMGETMATILAFHAHPDDEVLLTGGTLARAAADGHRVVVVVATNSMDGTDGRLAELRASAGILGVAEVVHLGYAGSGHGPILFPTRPPPCASAAPPSRRPRSAWPRCSGASGSACCSPTTATAATGTATTSACTRWAHARRSWRARPRCWRRRCRATTCCAWRPWPGCCASR